MIDLSNSLEGRSTRFVLKKLAILGFKAAVAGCAVLASYFPIFEDGNIQGDSGVYFILIAVCIFIWWEFCR